MIFRQALCVLWVTELVDGATHQLLRTVTEERSHSARTHTEQRQRGFITEKTLKLMAKSVSKVKKGWKKGGKKQ